MAEQPRAAKPRCEYTRWDRADGHMVYVCDRTPEAVEVPEGGFVYTCAYHRPWMLALARMNADA